ncbi:MAG: CIA30 family protein [Woeseiaceae bacterium]|nr:CIA30 family protein [Woeseiaceae bacterium]
MMTSHDAQAGDREELLTDFTKETVDFGWFVVNDNVMGGRSDGGFDMDEGTLYFAGRTNTRGGGFSSIRTRGPRLDLSDYDGVRLRVKGDGRRYTWQIRTNATYRGRDVSYWAEFETRKNEWITVDLPFTSFVPKFRGFQIRGAPPDPSQIRGMGLMIYDGKDGPFKLSLDQVQAYAETEELFTLGRFLWDKRVLLVNAPDAGDAELERLTGDIDQTIDEFENRDMVLVTLLDSGRASAGTRELARAEVDEMRAAVGVTDESFSIVLVGKDGGIKLRSDSPTSLNEIYALIDEMPMRRQEMRRSKSSDDA